VQWFLRSRLRPVLRIIPWALPARSPLICLIA
jgi:hypothetical protein